MDNKYKMKKTQMNLSKARNPNDCQKGIISFFLKVFIIICIISPRTNSSSIQIIINQAGIQSVFTKTACKENSFIEPDEIYINGIQKEVIQNNYTLESSRNNITLVWEREINSTACLFNDCHNITQVDLSNFHSSELMFIHGMFWHCKSLLSINFMNFNTSKVIDMHYLFNDCQKLNNLDLSYFDTTEVTNMAYMFAECHSLNSLNLSNFKTSKVDVMYNMFSGCYSLSILDLANFDTSSLTKMHKMFENCLSLTSINISHFKTALVDNMAYMFSNCSNLNIIDLSNFDFSSITNMTDMFINCSKLEYINLNNATIGNKFKNQTFINLTKNLVICSNNEGIINLERPECSIIDCNENWRKNQKKLYNDKCYDNCSIINLYDYNNKCYENCPNGTYNNNYICEYCDEKCILCSDLNFCTLCKDGYYNLFINSTYSNCVISSNISSEITSHIGSEEFNSDNNSLIDIQCYSSCKTCKEKGDKTKHNCIKCKDGYPFEEIFSNYKNCYETNVSINETKINKIDKIIQNFQFDLINDFNSSLVNNKIETEMEHKKVTVELVTTYDEKNKESKNETIINLGECENKLKETYGISNKSSLYILKIEVNATGMKIPKIEYEVYYPLNGSNLVKLNLSACTNIKIELSLPVFIDDDIEKYNQSSDYYNDICSKTTSKYGTDICIKDRQNEFIENNMTLCEEDCILIDYNNDNKKAKCSCMIKLNLPLVDNIEIDTNKLYKSFTDINSFANIKMMKCFNNVLKPNEIRNNFGFLIFLFIVSSFFIILFLFLFKFYEILKKQISQIITAKKNMKEKDEIKNIIGFNNKNFNLGRSKIRRYDDKLDLKKSNKINKKQIENKEKKSKEIKEIKIPKFKEEEKSKVKKGKKSNSKSKKKKIKEKKRNKKKEIHSNENSYFTINNNNYLVNSNTSVNSKIELKDKENKKYEEILKLNDYELNTLPYEKALDQDKRTYFEYYYSLLKMNHIFIFIFFNDKDYNSKVIKIFLLIFSFSLNLTINALFFSDETMHKIYKDKGTFNFIYQLPQILYSTIISAVINIIIKKLALSEKDVLRIKQEKKKEDLDILKNKLLSKLKIKFSIFFVLSFSFLILFWTFITCFCGVYKNTQTHLIKDSIIGFVTSLLYPFGIYLIPGIFRISALRAENKDQSCLYKFSKLIQMI